jgi:hypothetical protein
MESKTNKEKINPEEFFAIGQYEENTNWFFGREEEIKRIIHRIKTRQSTSIIGKDNIGKSFLLEKIFHLAEEQLDPNEFSILRLSLKDAAFQKQVLFLKSILRKLNFENNIRGNLDINKALVSFSDSIEKLDKTILLLIDDFDRGMNKEKFSKDFYDDMHDKIGHRKIVFVTASKHSIKFSSMTGGLTSSFFLVFDTVELGPFQKSEAFDYIYSLFDMFGFRTQDQELLRNLCEAESNREPMQLKLACKTIHDIKKKKLKGQQLYKEFNKNFRKYEKTTKFTFLQSICFLFIKYVKGALGWILKLLSVAKKAKDLS